MPKLFPILIEVEQFAVGSVMMTLNKMPGVAKIGLDFDRSGKRPAPNGAAGPRGPRGPYKKRGQLEKSGCEVIAEAIYARPAREAVSTGQLRQVFVADGRSAKSVHSQLHKLKKMGDIKSTPDGWILSKKVRDRMRSSLNRKKGRK